jgi:signal transduction histidine kinase
MTVEQGVIGSVRFRTAAAAALTVGLILGSASVVLVRHLRHNVVQNAQATASVRAHDASSLLSDGHLPRRWSLPDDKTAFAQILTAGKVVAATSNVGAARSVVGNVALGSHTTTGLVVDPDAPFRVVEIARLAHGRQYEIIAGTSMDDALDSIASTREALTGAVPALVLLVGLLTWIAAGRALRPVESLRADVELIATSGLDRRVEQTLGGAEIRRLAKTMNQMLDAVEQSARSQRNFVADASHELRNPLAALRAELEIALAQPGRTPWEQVVTNALGDTQRIQALARDLLLLAQLDVKPMTSPVPVDLTELARSACEDLGPQVGDQVMITAHGPAVVQGHPAQLKRLVKNLIENAHRHAHTQVRLDVAVVPGAAQIGVSDDGDGIKQADLERIFERFVRLDDARSRDAGGSGLGLAIARQITERHGGTITAHSGSPGAIFTVTLPLAPTC